MMHDCKMGATPKNDRGLHRQQGVTLVELMVALAIGLLVTVAMLKVYVDASGMYRFNEGLARVQENGRFSLEFIRRDARVAGFWGCYSDAALSNGVSAASDAFINVGAGHITGTSDDGLNSADSITFRSATGSGSPLTTTMSGPGAGVTVENAGALSTGTAVLISDCENGDLFQVTGISGTTLAHAAAADANTSPNLSKAYAAGARVYEAHETTFSIQNDPSSGVPTLYREVIGESAQPLVEGIENLQVLYGEDTDADADGANGDGTANRYVAFGTSGLDIDRIVSVRISLLVRSLNNNLTTEPAPYTFNGSTVTPVATDKYLRKVFTTTVTLRNKAG
ncbi:MAG: PilW family protein, partial [Arenicellales bacterium]|nr:PilW family protein [Arenicellales bacterium]